MWKAARAMTTFFVPGVPAPQGSKRLVRSGDRTMMINANSASLKEWRRVVTLSAPRMDWAPRVPLSVTLGFVMPATLKDRSGWCAVRPDIDKLCRAVLDGLTDAGTVVDDSQIAQLCATKQRGLKAGVQVTVEAL